jgi:hypothetical protein
MTEEQQSRKGGGFTNAVTKKALAPIVASAATAGTAYLVKKGSQVWSETLLPKIQEKGGGRAVASDALGGIAERLPTQATEKLDALKSKVGGEGSESESQPTEVATSADSGDRDQERLEREQRRQQRKRTLEQAGSS